MGISIARLSDGEKTDGSEEDLLPLSAACYDVLTGRLTGEIFKPSTVKAFAAEKKSYIEQRSLIHPHIFLYTRCYPTNCVRSSYWHQSANLRDVAKREFSTYVIQALIALIFNQMSQELCLASCAMILKLHIPTELFASSEPQNKFVDFSERCKTRRAFKRVNCLITYKNTFEISPSLYFCFPLARGVHRKQINVKWRKASNDVVLLTFTGE